MKRTTAPDNHSDLKKSNYVNIPIQQATSAKEDRKRLEQIEKASKAVERLYELEARRRGRV